MAAQTPAVGMERKLAAIFSTDVAGYSRLMGDDEEATIRTLTTYRAAISSLIQQYRGRVVDSPGDNLLAEFASVVDAVRCAVEIQHALKEKNTELPEPRRMHFRIGINLGDVIVEGERLYGDGVNIAARLESLAIPGGICISGTVYDQVKNKVVLGYDYLGEREVKNIAEPVRVYRIQLEETESSKFHVQGSKAKERRTGFARRKGAMVAVTGLVLIATTFVTIRYLSRPPLSPQPSVLSPQPSPLSPQSSALVTEEAKPPLPLPDKPSIAVLPFTNMSADPEQEYFNDGITDSLITDLSKISGLFVIARHSIFTYKGQAVQIAAVGRELGVRHVLEGSVQKAGNRVRINVQLIDAPTGGHVWAERYDRELGDIFALQDEIIQKIVFALKVTLTPEEQERLRRYPTANLEAYDAFLRGWEYWWGWSAGTKEANAQARRMAERAVELDSQYAAAYALLSLTYQVEWMYQWSEDPKHSLERATELAQKAVTLDGSLPVAHWILGWCYVYQRQYEQAIAEGEQAIILGPNYADAYLGLAEILNWAGRPEEALRLTEKAMRLNPHYFLSLGELGHAYYLMGRNEEAMAAFKRVLSHCPDCLGTRSWLASIYVESGREEEARAQVAEILQRNPNFSTEGILSTYKDQAQAARLRNALRKAGLK